MAKAGTTLSTVATAHGSYDEWISTYLLVRVFLFHVFSLEGRGFEASLHLQLRRACGLAVVF
jgi:hypothetical protein